MSKKTLTLIIGLIGITVILFAVALLSNNATPLSNVAKIKPTPTPYAQSTLMMTPNPIVINANRRGSVDVVLDTQSNEITAVQLEISFDPTILTNVTFTPGTFFSANNVTPEVIISPRPADLRSGRITYAIVVPLSQKAIKGNGVVASLSFSQVATLPRVNGVQPTTTELTILPKSLVTAEGVSKSVLKQATGTVINLYNPNTTTPSTGAQTLPVQPTTPNF